MAALVFVLLLLAQAQAPAQRTGISAKAYWLSRSAIAVPLSANDAAECSFSLAQNYTLKPKGMVSADPELRQKFPYLSAYTLLDAAQIGTQAEELIRQGPILSGNCRDGSKSFVTALQLFGLLDEIACYKGNDLGLSFTADGRPVFKLWAPTARAVVLLIYSKSTSDAAIVSVPMERAAEGVWSAIGQTSWRDLYYLYQVDVFAPRSGGFVTNLTTDPYSVSLSTNGTKSHILDLSARANKPERWDEIAVKGVQNPTDAVIYELHVRDFSSKGYLGFVDSSSLGMRHLRSLAESGLTHVHLLPVFDFGSVNEDLATRHEPEIPRDLPPDSDIPARLVNQYKDTDAYNWGYDPVHYFAPEGSYASQPDGGARVFDFRQMVAGLEAAGLTAIMDIVFNHTYASSGKGPVLDQVVPDYYFRLDPSGKIQSTTCGECADTASEHAMMEKLMADAVVSWARNFKIGGFRFDLMGHHTKGNLRALRAALDRLTLEHDGIDGRKVLLYGEGWKFGSLDAILPSESAAQSNLYGEGIGTFNDRIRDRVRGGNFQTDAKSAQGFVTGLFYDDNGLGVSRSSREGSSNRDARSSRELLLQYGDVIRVGMAGNLRDYSFRNYNGATVTGGSVDYGGSGAGYTASPSETINYVSCHDNYTLWDQIEAKAPFANPRRYPDTADIEERVRMQKLALGIIALSEGIPFFDAGAELLRSKSGTDNSYNFGDWFNAIDFSMNSNGWGKGLPPDNERDWPFWAPRLRSNLLRPGPTDIASTAEYFKALLRVRRSSPLFRLSRMEDVSDRLRFLETVGSVEEPGLIVMSIRDDLPGRPILDTVRKRVVAAFNVTRSEIRLTNPELMGLALRAHSDWTILVEPRVAQSCYSGNIGEIVVPPQSLMVWESPR